MQLKKPDYIQRFLCVLLYAVVLCGVFSYVGTAMAAVSDGPQVQPATTELYQGDLFCPYNYDAITGRVAHCIEMIVLQAAENFIETFLPYYEAIVIAVLTLAVTIYGAMLLMGAMTRPAAQTFFALFKLAAVAYFCLGFAPLITTVFDIMHGLLAIVTNYVADSSLSACSNSSYLPEFFHLSRDPNNLTAWDKVDCLFMTLLGIGMMQVGAAGIIALMGYVAHMGGIGFFILALAVGFLLTFLFSVMRALQIYLMSVITVAFLMCVSPIIIPMILFSATRPLFDKWLKNLANYMIIPIFLFAFLSMIVAAYDAILFKGPSSLYYAIASEASQQEGFSFQDWLELGTDGEAARKANGDPQFDGAGVPILKSGSFVGKDVPGLDAIAILGYKRACREQTGIEREMLGEMCDKSDAEIDTMFRCALQPKVPYAGESTGIQKGQECSEMEGRPYYGFLRNEEMYHFAIAPNVISDAERRKKAKEAEEEDCGRFDLWCGAKKAAGAAGDFVGKASGWAFDKFKYIVGAVWRFGGWLTQVWGSYIKAMGRFVSDYCHMGTLTPGAVCDVAGGAFNVAGSVVHATGSIANFGGRVMMNGLAAELGELFEGWFDVDTMDLQKVASYRCKVDQGLGGNPANANSYMPYLECPGPEDIVMDILYVMITAMVVAYLMLRWLNYIPTLGSTLVGSARVEASLPGESQMLRASGKIQHRIDELMNKKRGGGKK